VTNACLSAIEHRSRRVLPLTVVGPADPYHSADPIELDLPWLEPYAQPGGLDDTLHAPEARYEQLERVELAFVAALQHLSP
jgi:RNA polymerase sigma-70 factor (ECF subfamily)